MPLVEQIQAEQLEEAGVKDIALGAAMAASSLFGGTKAKAQAKIPTDQPAITHQLSTSITADEKKNWDEFQSWLKDNNYAGNPKMDTGSFRKKVLQQYENETGKSAPDTNFVKKLQQYQIDSRNDVIKNIKSGNATLGGKTIEDLGPNYDWDTFQPEVLSMEKSGGIDGKIGQQTSKYKFRIWKDSKTYTIPGKLK